MPSTRRRPSFVSSERTSKQTDHCQPKVSHDPRDRSVGDRVAPFAGFSDGAPQSTTFRTMMVIVFLVAVVAAPIARYRLSSRW